MSRSKRDDLMCGSWMYKPKSKGKGQSAVASLFSSIGGKKWSKRWIWTSPGALNYTPKPTLNPENTVTFDQVLDARVVTRNGMSKEGCPDNLLDFGWVLCCKDKDILFACGDADTRNRYVQFFQMQKLLRQSGYDDEKAADAEEFRRRLAGFDMAGGAMDDRESMRDTQSSVAFDEDDDDGYRLPDEDDVAEEDAADEEQAPTPKSQSNSRSRRSMPGRRSVSFGSGEFDTCDFPEGEGGAPVLTAAALAAQTQLGGRSTGGPRGADAMSKQSARQPDAPISAAAATRNPPLLAGSKGRVNVSNLLKKTVTKAMEARSSYDKKLKLAMQARKEEGPPQRAEGEGRGGSLRAAGASAEDLSIEAAMQRTMLRERRWFEAMPPVSTGNGAVRSFHVYSLSALSGFASQLNDYVLLNRDDRSVGVAVGTVEGLLLRAAGEVDSSIFGIFVSTLNRSTMLHGGNEPVLSIETEDGKIMTCSHQHGRFVAVSISAPQSHK
jgi:hypothetical protein